MRRNFFCLLALLSCARVFAESPSYEASPGLIALGGYVIFFNSRGPLSFHTLTPKEIPRDALDLGGVKCESCQHGISIPILTNFRSTSVSAAQGDGSFRKALANLQRKRPEIQGIYDVKIDYHRTSVLGIYRRVCTEVAGRAFK